MVVVQMASPLVLPHENLSKRVNTCLVITNEALKQNNSDILSLHLAVAWQESGFTMEAKGKWLCTGGGRVLNRGSRKPKCSKGRLTRAVGPMQILPIYHCKSGKKCNYVEKSVKLLSSLTYDHGIIRGLEIYAGGYGKSPAAKKYAKMTISRGARIDNIFNFIQDVKKMFGV